MLAEDNLRPWPPAAVWLAVLAIAFGVTGCGGGSGSKASLASSGGRTLHLASYGDCCGGFNPVPFVDNGEYAFMAYLQSDGLIDAHGKKVGYYHLWCTVGVDRVPPQPEPGSSCAYYFNLRDGQIVAEGAAGNPVPWTVPIIGGTGAYLGARGSVTTVSPNRFGLRFDVRLD